VFRLPSQQVQRMGQQRQYRPQRALRARRTPRQIHDQTSPCNPTNPSSQRRKRRMPRSILPYQLRQPRHHPLAHRQRSLRRNIPLRQPGPAGSHHQRRALRYLTQHPNQPIQLIRNHPKVHIRIRRSEQPHNSRPGDIRLRPRKAPVAHCQHHRPISSHLRSLNNLRLPHVQPRKKMRK